MALLGLRRGKLYEGGWKIEWLVHEKRRTDVISTLRETEISLRLTRIKANVNVGNGKQKREPWLELGEPLGCFNSTPSSHQLARHEEDRGSLALVTTCADYAVAAGS